MSANNNAKQKTETRLHAPNRMQVLGSAYYVQPPRRTWLRRHALSLYLWLLVIGAGCLIYALMYWPR